MQASDILKKYGLRHTAARVKIFDLFAKANKSFSLPDLEDELGNEMDRATIYRNLLTLHDSGILHQVKNSNGTNTYILSKHQNEGHHAHFVCVECRNVECLHAHNIEKPSLPKGYTLTKLSYLVEGFCKSCSK